MIRAAVLASESIQARIAEEEAIVAKAQAALRKLREEHAAAEKRLAALVASGQCSEECGSTTRTHKARSKPKGPHVPSSEVEDEPKVPVPISLKDSYLDIQWRIACLLLYNPVLDYQSTAVTIWGPLDRTTARNRVNGQVQHLRKLGVVESLGSNTYRVDAAKLAQLCGLPVTDGVVIVDDDDLDADRKPAEEIEEVEEEQRRASA